MSAITRLLFALLIVPFIISSRADAQRTLKGGRIRLDAAQMRAGTEVELTGEWLYKPGYLMQANAAPPRLDNRTGYVPVPVPQLLSRTMWWLDDSEDFKKFENERLRRLGFDTERVEDGWYRLEFEAPQLPAGRRLFVAFEGVAMRSKTFCNGALLGEHTGMFSRFDYDLTARLKPGRNVLDVYVSMERVPVSTLSLGQAISVNLTASKILTLNKGMFGPLAPDQNNRNYDLHGIWQPVRFVVRGEAKIEDVWFKPTLDGADVQVEASGLRGAQGARLKARWIDKETGKLFAEIAPMRVDLAEGVMKQATLTLRNVRPKLWTPAEPYLYRLEVSLETLSGEVLDVWTHSVGFRTFERRGNKFYLNGKPYWLRGANQLPYGKNSWDAELPRKLIKLMHDANIRLTRTHATPWNEAWLDAADEIGLGISVEGLRPWALAGKIGTPPPEIFRHWLEENEDVVKRGRNHPSVLLWTVGNEMLLRDHGNLEKWKLLSEVVKQTRRLDPRLPVIADSSYVRDEKFYREVLQPNNIDDGDVDDLHRYRGWYSDSPFVIDSKIDVREAISERPFIGQEMSTGYPDLDTGLPTLRYTRDLLTPQAWVGQDAYPGSDPAVFLEHNRAVTKRWAEQLRFQRGDVTAGFMMFSAECWFRHSYDARSVASYPVYASVREAWSPIGVALETGRRRFYAGEEINTGVFVTNDDEQFRDLSALQLQVSFVDAATRREVGREVVGKIDRLPYYQTARVPVKFTVPRTNKERANLQLVMRVLSGGKEVSRSTDRIEVFQSPNRSTSALDTALVAQDLTPALVRFVRESGMFSSVMNSMNDAARASVVLLNGQSGVEALRENGKARQLISQGATAILFAPDEELVKLFPQDILSVRGVTGEYADLAPARGTMIAAGLQAMDVKWWGREKDWRVFVASRAHRLNPKGRARELIRFIPSHGYISAERVPEQYMTVLFEIRIGEGRLWACDLDLEQSVLIDPTARRLATNLLLAAANPNSTKNLPVVPTHEQQLAGRKSLLVSE
ncbi:MAG: hypothetical protein H0V88_15135 [Pyrinomonadaceae bacterium]|nr:hypothetical protein [Pyrinomonadaceae bacterium]